MKGIVMTTPPLEQIYNQRYQYEQHKKKLMKIYQERKSHLGFDSQRMSHLDSVKQTKTKSFIHKFNETNQSIAKDNQTLLKKLHTVKPSLRHSASEERERTSLNYNTPYIKKRMFQTEKQNMRIVTRMKNLSSSLNQKNLLKDYAKSQQIKNRLMKYTADQNSQVHLKSQRYFNDTDGSKSVLSNKSRERSIKDKQLGHSSEPRRTFMKPLFRKSAISHYKKQDILKNKIDTSTSNLAGIKLKNQFRPNTSMDAGKLNAEVEQQGHFFTTQPNKKKVTKKFYIP